MSSTIVDLGGQNVGLGAAKAIAPSYPYAGFMFNSTSAVTASTTHTQAGATPITTMMTNVTNGNAADAVVLPPALAGLNLTVKNTSTTLAMQVYASGTDTIQITTAAPVAGSTGVSHAAGLVFDYFCFVNGAWQQD